MLNKLAKVCFEHIERLCQSKDVRLVGVLNDEDFRLKIGDGEDFHVILDDFEIEEGDETNEGVTLNPGRSFVKLLDEDSPHGDILDACIDALAQSPICAEISDLTTDGDNKDCEAIFNVADYGYVILKVR